MGMAESLDLKLNVKGMHCDACVRRLQMALRKVPGVEPVEVQVGSAHVLVDYAKARPEQVIQAVENAGFTASIAG